ncbi:MAG: hypothetical protein ACFFBE_11985 [Promethearchaeota archaeon]
MNKNKKIVAFAMFETTSIHLLEIISTLNQFLKKRLIEYYTIQLNTLEIDKKIFILNFEENRRDSIVKIFHEVEKDLVEKNYHLKFFKNSKLEWKFLEPILKKSSSRVSLMRQSNSILFQNSSDSFLLNIYSVNLDYLDSLESFIKSFLNIVNSFSRNGYLIFNFRIDNNNEIIIHPFFAEKCKMDDEPFNTENRINNFFNYSILKKQVIKIKQIFNLLWRLGLFDNHLSMNYFDKLFIEKNQDKITNLLKFNKGFEQRLTINQIKYMRLGKNLLLIEDKFLFICLPELKSKYIYKIIEKYYSKYVIYITILDEKGINKLREIPEFQSLYNLKILNSKQILEFNFDVFRNNK